MKTNLKKIIAMAVVATAIAVPAAQADSISDFRNASTASNSVELKFVNQSGLTIHNVYVSSASSSNWGNDRLGTWTLRNGHQIAVNVPRGRYDIKLVDSDRDECVMNNVPVNQNRTLTITFNELVRCQGL